MSVENVTKQIKEKKGHCLVAITSEELKQYEINDIVLTCTNNILVDNQKLT